METLDEVIKANECCDHGEPDSRCEDCPYNGIGACCAERESDALHYLREYRSEKVMWEAERKGYLDWIEQYKEAREKHQQAVIELKKNPALTWEQLKQMEGKPVWVEILSDEIDLTSRWMMVARETKAHSLPLAYTDDMGHWIYGHEDDLGKTWQAYRKERE